MSEKERSNTIRSRIWSEEPEADNPFATKAAYCRGYDVYGEMLGRTRWVDMLYLLFREEAPTPAQADLLEILAVALANPGPRDASVHAAMCGGVCGSSAASSLMAALAVGAGQLSGGREVFVAMQGWAECGTSLDAWRAWIASPADTAGSVWPQSGHAPGFDPHGVSTATTVRQTLSILARHSTGPYLRWCEANREALEGFAGIPMAFSGLAAATLADLGFTPEQGEMIHLLLRLPGAAAHALEQTPLGYKKFPFGQVQLLDANDQEQK